MNTEWQLAGSMAERYEEFLVPVIFVPWARDLLARAALRPGDRLLDLACGTGIVARLAGQAGASVVGSDINADMLALAETRTAGADIRYEQADATDLPFLDASFDAVICQQGLQFFPDKQKAVREVFRVLRPGGVAVFCVARDLSENPLMSAQVAAFEAHLGAGAGDPIRAVCGFAASDRLGALFTAAGFDPVQVDHIILDLEAADGAAFVAGLMQASPVAARLAEAPDATRRAVQSGILDGFGAHFDGRQLTFPHSANVVTATCAG